jgi:hypothetical protein
VYHRYLATLSTTLKWSSLIEYQLRIIIVQFWFSIAMNFVHNFVFHWPQIFFKNSMGKMYLHL